MIEFAKGHGTGNDFIVVPDVDGQTPLTAPQIAALCHRRTGIGADGLLRVVRAAKHPEGAGLSHRAEWFMDYYNADGSVAEMCGNGSRVFAKYLLQHGLSSGETIPIATRAGLRTIDVVNGQFAVDMGAVSFAGDSTAVINGTEYPGIRASMGNPHLVCEVFDPDTLDLTAPPAVNIAHFPDGVNVEFYRRTRDGIGMRVHERGVGETLSCGTGACAAAAVALGQPGELTVDVPGGRLLITVTTETVILTGPATLVAEGHTGLV